LYDKALGMYKLNTDITSETEEIGRTRVFPRGWLENESIWLHMEYKYLLELLRRGLYEEYYEALYTCCVAFMPPERYGRSILENSSFIVSSAHPDKAIHGLGCVARLSGSTAEFTHLWMFMNAGITPFVLDAKGGVELALRPALDGRLFSKEKAAFVYVRDGREVRGTLPAGTYAFMFMGRTLVVYHNAARRNTFGLKNAGISRITLHYAATRKTVTIDGAIIPARLAGDVRDGKIKRIDAVME